MENGLNYTCVSNSGRAIVKRLVIEKHVETKHDVERDVAREKWF